MTCEEAERILMDELSGRADPAASDELRQHVSTCRACREAASAQSQVSRILASRPETPVRRDFAARVAGEIARQSGWFGLADWRWLSVRLAPVAALLLLLAGLVVERQATQTATPASLSGVVRTWAAGGSEGTPVTAVLWQPQPNEDAAVLTLLAAPSDATIVEQGNER